MNDIKTRNHGFLQTGQHTCHDPHGREISRQGTGQDAAFCSGQTWPESRFVCRPHGILDQFTGLLWQRNANHVTSPVSWAEALAGVAKLNPAGTSASWRLLNINELESLIDCSGYKPALPPAHHLFFTNVHDIYWSSTTSLYETDWAWALYLDKGALGVGKKSFARLHVWPVMDAL